LKKLNEYTIQFKGLKNGTHEYNFQLDNAFFGEFGSSEIEKGNISAKVILTKKSQLLQLEFDITGGVWVTCDRCLGGFEMPVHHENEFIVKFDDEKAGDQQFDEEIIYLGEEEHELKLARYLYESVVLSLPVKKIHPDNEEGESTCDSDMLDKLDEHGKKSKGMDPRWEALRKLRNN
jgi:uncharacterized metal-binding protein YceD (DUF177 family)